MRVIVLLFIGLLLAACLVVGSLCYLNADFHQAFNDWISGAGNKTSSTINQLRSGLASPDQLTTIRKAARAMIPQCEELVSQHPADAQMLLGVAFIYRNFPNRKCSYAEAIDRVLLAAPSNIPAIAMKTELINSELVATVIANEASLDRMIRDQRSHGTGKLIVRPDDEPIYSMVDANDAFVVSRTLQTGPAGRPGYVIEDIASARASLVQRMRSGFDEAVAQTESAGRTDPQNAFYDYMKARLLFECGRNSEAIACIKTALGKPGLTNYVDQLRQEADKIMVLQRYPKICRDYIATAGSSAGDLVVAHICRDRLDRLATQARQSGDVSAADEYSALSTLVRKHCGAASPEIRPLQKV